MNYQNDQIAQVWLKAQYIDQENEGRGFRKDLCGAWIRWSDYGNRNSNYGWEIDHKKPLAQGGSDVFENLRPLHWQNNAAKSDGALVCVTSAYGLQNAATTILGAMSLT